MDHVSPEVRSWMMSRIRSKNTTPEMRVRRYLHAAGLRYRLHISALSGKPDLVFPQNSICIFVHGCFWHGCPNCTVGRRQPKSNKSYWLPKIKNNVDRDRLHVLHLRDNGWKVFVIWECETRNPKKLEKLAMAIRKSKNRLNIGITSLSSQNCFGSTKGLVQS